MRLAILGTRGVPAAYGGFETMAEELGARLAERGHDVTVYCRGARTSPDQAYRGMRLRFLPTIRQKHLETIVHTTLSVLDTLRRQFDVILVCNVANAPVALVPRLVGTRVAINVDGLEWEREKWGRLARSYFRTSAWLAARLPVAIVSDARYIAAWYAQHHRRSTTYIPYGSDGTKLPPGPALADLGLQAGCYVLYVSRLEPENHASTVIDGYAMAGALDGLGLPLVIVGDAPYATAYRQRVQRAAQLARGVILAGYQFGDAYVELQSNAAIYVQATEVGGTHPALVEAMSRGVCILANDVPEHREVLGPGGIYYRRNDPAAIAALLTELVHDSHQRQRSAQAAALRAQRCYSWSAVTDQYENLFMRLLATRPRRRSSDPDGLGRRAD